MELDQVRMLPPIGRLAYWIQERETIRIRKERGLTRPWTDDDILANYRFTNVRRMDDKVSRWLLSRWYEPNRNHPNMLAAASLARFFNLPYSLGLIGQYVFVSGGPRWDAIKRVLRSAAEEGPIFNGAYMVRGNDGIDKVECVLDYYVRPLIERIGRTRLDTSSMEGVWNMILPSYGFGSFMAGQVVADLRWALTGSWDDCYTWAPKGPGSAKGMNLLHERDEKTPLTQSFFGEELRALIERLEGNDSEGEPRLPHNLYERLEAIDYQNCLCEFFKYEKALWGRGKPKQLYPSKTRRTR